MANNEVNTFEDFAKLFKKNYVTVNYDKLSDYYAIESADSMITKVIVGTDKNELIINEYFPNSNCGYNKTDVNIDDFIMNPTNDNPNNVKYISCSICMKNDVLKKQKNIISCNTIKQQCNTNNTDNIINSMENCMLGTSCMWHEEEKKCDVLQVSQPCTYNKPTSNKDYPNLTCSKHQYVKDSNDKHVESKTPNITDKLTMKKNGFFIWEKDSSIKPFTVSKNVNLNIYIPT